MEKKLTQFICLVITNDQNFRARGHPAVPKVSYSRGAPVCKLLSEVRVLVGNTNSSSSSDLM